MQGHTHTRIYIYDAMSRGVLRLNNCTCGSTGNYSTKTGENHANNECIDC